MSGTAEGLRRRCGVAQGADGGRTVVGADARRAALYLVDGEGKGGAQQRRVVLHLMGQLQLFGSADGDGSAEHAAGVLQHEVHHLWRYLLSGTYQVAFVFAVLVVNHNDELAFLEVGQCLFDSIQFQLFHIPYLYSMY